MSRAGLCVLLLASRAAVAEPPAASLPSAALVAGEPAPPPARLDDTRRRLGQRYRLVGDRELLEASPDAAAAVRAALERAHQRLRRFDLGAVAAALADARAAAELLLPGDEGRALQAEVALREAELAIVQRDGRAQERAMALALSAQPELTLDPEREPPPLVSLWSRTRAALAHAPRVALRVESTPPGAQIVVGGAVRGVAPLEVRVAAAPQLVWALLDGYRPRVERVAAGGGRVTLALVSLDARARLRPLVDAIRRGDAARRRQAAATLAGALSADHVLVVDADGAVTELTAVAAPATVAAAAAAAAPLPANALVETGPPPAPAAHRPWYRSGWTWGIVGGVVVAGITAGVVAAVMTAPSPPRTVELTCCK